MNVECSRFEENEWEDLRAIRLRALRQNPGSFLQDIGSELNESAQFWKARCSNENWFAARIGPELVGVARLRSGEESRKLVYIESMWVDEKFRRKGVASAVLARLEAEAAAWGRDEIALWVFVENEEAHNLYEKFGYEGPISTQVLKTSRGLVVEEQFFKSLGSLSESPAAGSSWNVTHC